MKRICINCGKSVSSKLPFYFGARFFCNIRCAKRYYKSSNKGFSKPIFKEAIKRNRKLLEIINYVQ